MHQPDSTPPTGRDNPGGFRRTSRGSGGWGLGPAMGPENGWGLGRGRPLGGHRGSPRAGDGTLHRSWGRGHLFGQPDSKGGLFTPQGGLSRHLRRGRPVGAHIQQSAQRPQGSLWGT